MDSASSVNIVSNKSLLSGIFKLGKKDWLPIITIGKEVVYLKQIGYLGDYPKPVYYYPQGTANILSLYNVKKDYCITMNTDKDNAFYMHLRNGEKVRFGAA
eukprot:2279181-Ditylum_brightwellii.AAC.1